MPRHGFCSSCQVSNWSFFLFGESLRSIQDSGSLSSVLIPVRNILYLFPLGFSVGLYWTALGLLVIPALLCGASTTVEYCVLVFSLTTGPCTSPQTLSGKLLLVFVGFCYPCYYLLLVAKRFLIDLPLGLKLGIQCPGRLKTVSSGAVTV